MIKIFVSKLLTKFQVFEAGGLISEWKLILNY
jgi:hypothetical protein